MIVSTAIAFGVCTKHNETDRGLTLLYPTPHPILSRRCTMSSRYSVVDIAPHQDSWYHVVC